MRNAAKAKVRYVPATPNDDEGWLVTWCGWEDVRAGKPYDPVYDALEEPQQLNYERGRAAAASVLGRTGRVPPWSRSVDFGSHMLRAVPTRDFMEIARELDIFVA